MLRSLAVARQEANGQQIEKALHEPLEAVLRNAVLPWAMVHGDFADDEAPRMGQHRNESVHLAVKTDFRENLAAVALEPAVVVVQANTGHPAHQEIEDLRRPDLVPRIETFFLPAADNVLSFFDFRDEAGKLFRVVLQ